MSAAKITFDAYTEAIKRCKIDNAPVKPTAIAYGVPRSTLQRYLKKIDEQLGDISSVEDGVLLAFIRRCNQRVPTNQIFTPVQEDHLVKYLLKCFRHYYGLSINELKELAYQFAKKLGAHYPISWDKDGKASWRWYYKFMARHPHLAANATRVHEDAQRRIVLHDADFRHVEKVATTPGPSTARSTSMNSFLILDAEGPLQGATPRKPSNRGRKPMQIAVLTWPPVLAESKEKAAKRAVNQSAKATKATSSKQSTKRAASATPMKPSTKCAIVSSSTSDDDEDRDFCIICEKLLPIRLTTQNSIECNTCHLPVHLRCADMHAGYYTCKHCDSDADD